MNEGITRIQNAEQIASLYKDSLNRRERHIKKKCCRYWWRRETDAVITSCLPQVNISGYPTFKLILSSLSRAAYTPQLPHNVGIMYVAWVGWQHYAWLAYISRHGYRNLLVKTCQLMVEITITQVGYRIVQDTSSSFNSTSQNVNYRKIYAYYKHPHHSFQKSSYRYRYSSNNPITGYRSRNIKTRHVVSDDFQVFSFVLHYPVI